MISIARTTNRNVIHWKDGQMVLRWTAAGMVNAQRSFRRVKGYKHLPQLAAALYRHAHPPPPHPPKLSVPQHQSAHGSSPKFQCAGINRHGDGAEEVFDAHEHRRGTP
jgi:hypothetical protein